VCFLFVKIFGCYVYFVSKETVRRQQNDKEWKLKEQHAKMWENIAGGEKKLSPPWFQHCGGERPRRPRRSDASVTEVNPHVAGLLLLHAGTDGRTDGRRTDARTLLCILREQCQRRVFLSSM